MFGSGKKRNAAKKAYEMAYALFRISAKISESSVRGKLESFGMDLLVSVNVEEYDNAAKSVAAIDALVKFAIDLNIVSIPNGDVLIREVAAMNEAIAECLDKSDEVDVSKFFSPAQEKQGSGISFDSVVPVVSRPSVAPVHISSVTPAELNVIPAKAGIQVFSERKNNMDPVLAYSAEAAVSAAKAGQRDDRKEHIDMPQSGNPANIIKSGNRQIAILDKIRQSGNCKLREIQEVLPDCSERTIRYDLEELIERNLVERIGAGGPAVSYRVRQSA